MAQSDLFVLVQQPTVDPVHTTIEEKLRPCLQHLGASAFPVRTLRQAPDRLPCWQIGVVHLLLPSCQSC